MYPPAQPSPRRTRPDARAYGGGASGYLARLLDDRNAVEDANGAPPNVIEFGPRPTGGGALASLQRGAGMGAGAPGYVDIDATPYQARRRAYESSVDADTQADIDRAKANDPNLRLYNDQQAREKAILDARTGNTIAGEGAAATDQRAIDTFGRTESLRMNVDAEAERRARAMLPMNPAYLQSRLKLEGVQDTDAARVQAAGITAGGRENAAATTGFSRVAAAPALGPDDTARMGGAMESLGRRAGLSGADPSKVFPADALNDFAAEHRMSPAQAREFLAAQNYTIR